MILKKLRNTVAAAMAVSLGLAGAALAEYPEKPITVVIPLGPGGSHDLNARVITSTIPQYLGQAMIVQLSPGAGGQKGTQEVANAEPDGYTLLFTHNYIDQLQQHVENLPYDTMNDFVTVARVNYAPIAIVVRGDGPYQTYEDLIAAAKEKPGELRMSHSGNWGATFVPGAQVMMETGAEFNLVPYQGGGPAMQALVSGDSDVTMGFPSVIGPHVESGKVRVLATAGDERIYEDVPSFTELGLGADTGFMHRVFLAPDGTPPEVIERLQEAFAALQEDTTYARLMSRLGENVAYIDGAAYQTIRESQKSSYEQLVKTITGQ